MNLSQISGSKLASFKLSLQCGPWCSVCAGRVVDWRGRCLRPSDAFPPRPQTSALERSSHGFRISKTWPNKKIHFLWWTTSRHYWLYFCIRIRKPNLFNCVWRFWIKLAPGWTSGPLRTSFLSNSKLALVTYNIVSHLAWVLLWEW